jgi:hypothetical protein
VLFVLLTIGDSSNPSSSKNPIHTSKLSGAKRVHEILTGHESLSKRNFPIEVGVFQALVNKLREKQLLADSRSISVEEKVAIFLYALAKNASNETLRYEFQHSGETISRHFGAMLDAITQLTCVYIRPPSLHQHQILRRPKFHPFFQVSTNAEFDFLNFRMPHKLLKDNILCMSVSRTALDTKRVNLYLRV